ncbi:unnamed protein product [Commensalibacter communis]|uniref:Uncharacterized protein n=1 Tax=Commensalibacter communis TaxID=2972786 RepID=A0A9W4TQX1_9PROT|nr:hypothetical protein [Commensalibacter communis]CAI3941497.1 unnamed protein product [Commensalibacter communis]CAI3945128.1 unnamed protein product [Commensalibacter communis]CAI3959286.1 unnamed protein product [Commensalibacter communis]CAI3960799.1 unnamed protein product [Commensalibacter communis]
MAEPVDNDDSEVVSVGTRFVDNFFKIRLLKFELIGGLDPQGNQYYFSNGDYFLKVDGHRSTVTISYFSGSMLGKAEITIYNLPHQLADEISNLGQYMAMPGRLCHQIIIYATTENSDENDPRYIKIFEGSILVSYTDYNAVPDYVTHIQAQTSGGFNNVPCPYVSYSGSVSSEDIVKAIVNNFKLTINSNEAQTLNVEMIKGAKNQQELDKIRARNPIISHVVNAKVTTTQTNPHFVGDLKTQLDECAKAGRFEYNIQQSILYMYPKGQGIPNVSESPPLFSVQTGMVGYPQYSNNGIIVKSVFKPFLIFGQPIRIQSKVKPACGVWHSMASMQHSLSSLMPDGDWYTTTLVSNLSNKWGSTVG